MSSVQKEDRASPRRRIKRGRRAVWRPASMSVVWAACASLCAGLLAAAAWLWHRRPRTSIPGPPALPLLGNAAIFYKLPVLLDRFDELHRLYGDIFRLYIGPKLLIVVTQPEDIKKLMVTSKPRERDPYITHIFRTFQGNGIVVSKGEVWKKHRKFIEPAFHKEELEKFVDTFNESGRFLCEKLAETNGAETEVSLCLYMASVRSITATIYGTKLESLVPDLQKQAELCAQFLDFAKRLSVMIYRPWTTMSIFKWLTPEGRSLRRVNNTSKRLFSKGLALVRENVLDRDNSPRSVLTCLDPETNRGCTFTENEMYEEVLTLVSAAIGTTSETLGYLLTLLALHPDWQERAQRELDQVFGSGGDYLRPATTADLAHLTVLDATIKETLRLFSTVPSLFVAVTEDTPLSGGRHVAPRGSSVLVATWLLHRHPSLFPRPLAFDPGRFLEGGSASSRKPYSYVPFGVGPRKCVGDRFAILQIKTVMATVLRRFRILPGSSRKDLENSVLSIATRPLTGFRVTCVPRDNIAVTSH